MDYYSENNNDNRQYYNPGYIKRSGGKIAGSVILSFFIAIFLFILLGMSAFKHLMKADNIRKMASRLDFSKLSSDILFESTDDDESMSDYLYEKIGEMKDIKEIPRDTFDEFVEKDLSPYFKGLLEDTADIQTVKTCTENSKKAVKTELINQTDSLKAKIEDLEKQVGNLNESISSVEKRLKKTDNISEELKQKWLPLLIGVPTAVQILSWTVYILWQVLQK